MVPVLLPQSDLSFGLPCGQGQGAYRTRHAPSYIMNFPPLASFLPPFLVPPFPPTSKPRISPARSSTFFIPLNNYPLVFFRGLALLGRSRIPIYSFQDPAFFPVFQRRHIQSTRAPCLQLPSIRQRGPNTSFLPQNTSAWMCTPMQQAILMVHKLTAVATFKARLLRQVCPVP
jgi:hypothetical protein